MTKYERDDFALFCQQATSGQLEAIIDKERAAAHTRSATGRYRKACLDIALAERQRRDEKEMSRRQGGYGRFGW